MSSLLKCQFDTHNGSFCLTLTAQIIPAMYLLYVLKVISGHNQLSVLTLYGMQCQHLFQERENLFLFFCNYAWLLADF